MRKIFWMFMGLCLLLPTVSYGRELTDQQIVSDYKAYMAQEENKECMDLIQINSITVLEKYSEGGYASAEIEVSADWIGDKGAIFYMGPCKGLAKTRGKNQTAPKVLDYRMEDSRWVLQGLQ